MTADDPEATEAESAMTIFMSAIRGSNLYKTFSTARLEMKSICFSSRVCHDITAKSDQQKVEVRHWLKPALAQTEFNVLEIVRGNAGDPEDYAGIPSKHRGLCVVGKLKSVG